MGTDNKTIQQPNKPMLNKQSQAAVLNPGQQSQDADTQPSDPKQGDAVEPGKQQS